MIKVNETPIDDVVRSINFGSRVAEDEFDDLRSYFVKTETWRRVRDGEVDVVLAPKGSGKSAIYSMLLSDVDALFDEKVLIAPAENPTGAPAFANIGKTDPTEDDLVKIWKLYFLVLICQELESYEVTSPEMRSLFAYLKDADLLPETHAKPTLLEMVKDYLRRLTSHKAAEGTLSLDPSTGAVTGFTGRIEFGEPSLPDAKAGFVSVDRLFDLIEATLDRLDGYTLWVLLDRLDVAFASTPDLERRALRALFRVYSDLIPYRRIRLKIFLRSDIWESISDEGFREASHIVRETSIVWDKDSLRQLVVRRLSQSDRLLKHYGATVDDILVSPRAQDHFFYQVFPAQVDAGSGKTAALEWALSRTQDGKGITAPRELIHLFSEVRAAQLKRVEMGQPMPTPPTLFSPRAFDSALPEVSKVRLQKTIYAEYIDAKPFIVALTGEKTEHNIESLARIWNVDLDRAEILAQRLVDIGILQVKAPNYWIPFMYRPELSLTQGAAPEVKKAKQAQVGTP